MAAPFPRRSSEPMLAPYAADAAPSPCRAAGRQRSPGPSPGSVHGADVEKLLGALLEAVRNLAQQPAPQPALGVDACRASSPDSKLRDSLRHLESTPMRAAGSSHPAALWGLGLGRGAADQTNRRLDELERNAKFWCGLVDSALPRMPRARCTSSFESLAGDVREGFLEDYYDFTPERVAEVYSSVLVDDAGRVTAEALGQALEKCGVTGLAADVPARILEAVAPICDGQLHVAEFESILSRLMIARLLVGKSDGFSSLTSPADVAGCGMSGGAGLRELKVVDYDARDYKVACLVDAALHQFLFGHRPLPKDLGCPGVRWVHADGLQMRSLLALTVKYSLHPLAVEDVIQQVNTKIDRHGNHYFAAIEQLCLIGEPSATRPVRVQGLHISAFCSGPPNLDTLITLTQPDGSFEKSWPRSRDEDAVAMVPTFDDAPSLVERLRRRIQPPRSRLRERPANFLLLQVFDICSDDLLSLTNAYGLRLGALEAQLHSAGASMPPSWLDELSTIRLQLAVVLRRVRGMLRALRQLDSLCTSDDMSGYIRDIADHLDEAFDDNGMLVEKCGVLIASYERVLERSQDEARQFATDRLNNTLFVLTVITTILMPLQLLAGVYGMNFVDAQGVSSIPELHWPNGYTYFWLFSLVYLVFSCIFAVRLYARNQRAVLRSAAAGVNRGPAAVAAAAAAACTTALRPARGVSGVARRPSLGMPLTATRSPSPGRSPRLG